MKLASFENIFHVVWTGPLSSFTEFESSSNTSSLGKRSVIMTLQGLFQMQYYMRKALNFQAIEHLTYTTPFTVSKLYFAKVGTA